MIFVNFRSAIAEHLSGPKSAHYHPPHGGAHGPKARKRAAQYKSHVRNNTAPIKTKTVDLMLVIWI
jgi:hypothetical protein